MEVATIAARPSAELAGVGSRLVSLLVDVFVILIPTVILGSIFSIGGLMASAAAEDAGTMAILGMLAANVLSIAISIGYYLFTWTIGVSVGMKVMGLRMVRSDAGVAPGFGRALVRLIVAYVSGLAIGLGYLWALWDPKKQTWHDKAAGTIVIRA